MNEREYLKEIVGINNEGQEIDSSYIVDLIDSTEWGKIFSKLENCDDLSMLMTNGLTTEESSSYLYESESEPFLLNLKADWIGNSYQLVVRRIS